LEVPTTSIIFCVIRSPLVAISYSGLYCWLKAVAKAAMSFHRQVTRNHLPSSGAESPL
jgi:hypothetical protein